MVEEEWMEASKRRVSIRAAAVMCASVFFLLCQPQPILPQAHFYQGKTITVIAGQEPGGLGDLRLKAILPYFKKHIPGQPNIVTEYMPGGGGRKAANYIFRTARPDGLTLGYPPGGFVRAAALGEPGVDYELDKLSFYGTAESEDHYVFLTRRDSNLGTLDRLRASPGVRIGAQSVGHVIHTLARLFAYILRLNEPKFVTGYSGPEMDQALLRGELDARVNVVPSLLRRNPEWVEKKLVDCWRSIGPSASPAQPLSLHRARRRSGFGYCATPSAQLLRTLSFSANLRNSPATRLRRSRPMNSMKS